MHATGGGNNQTSTHHFILTQPHAGEPCNPHAYLELFCKRGKGGVRVAGGQLGRVAFGSGCPPRDEAWYTPARNS